MAGCTLLRAAEEDLIGIWLYIADEDQQAATRVLQSIEDAFRLLANNARLGPAREDIAPGLRYVVVGSYLVLYRETPDGVEVVRVLHAARDLAAALQ